MSLSELLDIELLRVGSYAIKVSSVFYIVIVFLLTKLALVLIKRALTKGRLFQRFHEGQAMAYYQICRYVLIVVAISLVLESFGIKITFLLAGSAALLVGVGLGLQQLFNDLVSGFIILTEHTIKIGDIIEVDEIVAKVIEIGLRTSKIETANDISMIIPNSKIVNERMTNWSHNRSETRFSLDVGVAYGSDVDLVARLLKEAAEEHKDVNSSRKTLARFTDFGDSALIFKVLFWSENGFRIEDVKSDIRFAINRKFLENKIQIPFPQRDLHLKTSLLQGPIHSTEFTKP